MRTGIIGAMEDEVAALKEAMDVRAVTEIASMEFVEGTLEGQDVVVVRSGIGKVNAGICAQILAQHFQVSRLINTGIAGSLDAGIDIGDMVISTDAVQHDVDAETFGYPLGQIPQMDVLAFPADPELVKKAEEANRRANPDIQTFTGRQEQKDRIRDTFHPLCVEMEGAAIAQAAYLNKVSCVIIRAISDKADNSAVMDYPAFEKQAIAHSVALVRELMRSL